MKRSLMERQQRYDELVLEFTKGETLNPTSPSTMDLHKKIVTIMDKEEE